MRILLICKTTMKLNGVANVIMNLIRELSHYNNLRISLAYNSIISKDFESELLGYGIALYQLPNNKKLISYSKTLKHILQEKYDIVHIHGNSLSMLPDAKIAKRRGCKVILHCHNVKSSFYLFNKCFSRFFKNKYDLAIGCSEEAKNYLFSWDKKAIVFKNPIYFDKFAFDQDARAYYRKEFGINDSSFVLLQVGLFNKQKNHDFTIRLAEKMHNSSLKSNFVFLLIGDGKLKPKIVKFVQKKGLNEVIFVEARKDINKIYSSADCLLFPSLFESYGLVAVEAQINGLFCIASKHVPSVTKVTDRIKYLDLNVEEWEKQISIFNNQKREISSISGLIASPSINPAQSAKEILRIYNEL